MSALKIKLNCHNASINIIILRIAIHGKFAQWKIVSQTCFSNLCYGQETKVLWLGDQTDLDNQFIITMHRFSSLPYTDLLLLLCASNIPRTLIFCNENN